MAEQTRDFLFYSFILRGHGLTPTTEIDIERVNIRPRKFYFIKLINFCRSHMIKGKRK